MLSTESPIRLENGFFTIGSAFKSCEPYLWGFDSKLVSTVLNDLPINIGFKPGDHQHKTISAVDIDKIINIIKIPTAKISSDNLVTVSFKLILKFIVAAFESLNRYQIILVDFVFRQHQPRFFAADCLSQIKSERQTIKFRYGSKINLSNVAATV